MGGMGVKGARRAGGPGGGGGLFFPPFPFFFGGPCAPSTPRRSHLSPFSHSSLWVGVTVEACSKQSARGLHGVRFFVNQEIFVAVRIFRLLQHFTVWCWWQLAVSCLP